MTQARSGFTLVETIIALVLSSIVIVLVSTTFLVQNEYYSLQTLQVEAHDNVRAATERIASELRDAVDGGILVAGKRTLTIRSPIVVTAVCDLQLSFTHVHGEGGRGDLDTDEVAGVALQDSTGAWDYRSAGWSYVQGGGGPFAARGCADNGSDTAFAAREFYRIRRMEDLFGQLPDEGELLMLYRETTYKIMPSVLDPSALGLFRQISGDSPVEFATGMDSTAQFQYRTGGATYADTITSLDIGGIDAVRIVADALKPPATGGRDDVTFGWSVNVTLRHTDD